MMIQAMMLNWIHFSMKIEENYLTRYIYDLYRTDRIYRNDILKILKMLKVLLKQLLLWMMTLLQKLNIRKHYYTL